MKPIKIGDVLFSSWLMLDGCQNEKCTLRIDVWVVTSVNKNGAKLKEKIEGLTYGRLSTKTGDFGFFPKISAHHQKTIPEGDSPESVGLYRTKAAAVRKMAPIVKRKITELKRIADRLEKLIAVRSK